MVSLTAQQKRLLEILGSDQRIKERGYNLDELAEQLGTSLQGAARTASSLVRAGYVNRWMGGPGPVRVCFSLKPKTSIA